MIAKSKFCYLAAILAVSLGQSSIAVLGIVTLTLVVTPDFWRWAASVREVACRGMKLRRRA